MGRREGKGREEKNSIPARSSHCDKLGLIKFSSVLVMQNKHQISFLSSLLPVRLRKWELRDILVEGRSRGYNEKDDSRKQMRGTLSPWGEAAFLHSPSQRMFWKQEMLSQPGAHRLWEEIGRQEPGREICQRATAPRWTHRSRPGGEWPPGLLP